MKKAKEARASFRAYGQRRFESENGNYYPDSYCDELKAYELQVELAETKLEIAKLKQGRG